MECKASNAVLSTAFAILLMLIPKVKTVLNCTTPTSSCPQTEAEWIERGKYFNCGMQKYTCILTEDNNLVEVCMWNSRIKDGMVGCPFIAHCDKKHGPILISEDKYSPCPEHLDGCPNGNHTGYHVSEIHKYFRCLTVDRIAKDVKIGSQTTTTMSSMPSGDGQISTINIVILAVILIVSVIIVFLVSIILKFRSKCFSNSKKDIKKVVTYTSVERDA